MWPFLLLKEFDFPEKRMQKSRDWWCATAHPSSWWEIVPLTHKHWQLFARENKLFKQINSNDWNFRCFFFCFWRITQTARCLVLLFVCAKASASDLNLFSDAVQVEDGQPFAIVFVRSWSDLTVVEAKGPFSLKKTFAILLCASPLRPLWRLEHKTTATSHVWPLICNYFLRYAETARNLWVLICLCESSFWNVQYWKSRRGVFWKAPHQELCNDHWSITLRQKQYFLLKRVQKVPQIYWRDIFFQTAAGQPLSLLLFQWQTIKVTWTRNIFMSHCHLKFCVQNSNVRFSYFWCKKNIIWNKKNESSKRDPFLRLTSEKRSSSLTQYLWPSNYSLCPETPGISAINVVSLDRFTGEQSCRASGLPNG